MQHSTELILISHSQPFWWMTAPFFLFLFLFRFHYSVFLFVRRKNAPSHTSSFAILSYIRHPPQLLCQTRYKYQQKKKTKQNKYKWHTLGSHSFSLPLVYAQHYERNRKQNTHINSWFVSSQTHKHANEVCIPRTSSIAIKLNLHRFMERFFRLVFISGKKCEEHLIFRQELNEIY